MKPVTHFNWVDQFAHTRVELVRLSGMLFCQLIEAGFGAEREQKLALRDWSIDAQSQRLGEGPNSTEINIAGQVAFSWRGQRVDLLTLVIGSQRVFRTCIGGSLICE